jgi:hypothetical protein
MTMTTTTTTTTLEDTGAVLHDASIDDLASDDESDSDVSVHEETPVPAPLVDPLNPMRVAMTSAMYDSLYRRVISGNMSLSIPVNLSFMVAALVYGW